MISVLYVDDERDLCDLGKVFLEQTPEFAVTIFTSAREALSSPDLRRFDAIVADYQMPEMDGLEFLRRVRAEYGDIPFILFTGRGREEVVIEAINYGVDFYLQKGGDPAAQFAELAHKIRIAFERRQAQGALKDSEQRLNDIINFLPDATFAIDRAGTVIAWNRAIEEMTGVPATEMLGKGDHEYAIPFYGTRRKILIDLIFEDDEYIARTYAHIIHEKGILIADTTLPRPKGRTVTLLGKASPLYNRQGEVVGAIESIRDITERKRMEREIEAKHQQIINLMEGLPVGIFRTTATLPGRRVMANPLLAEMFGYGSMEEFMASSLEDSYADPEVRKAVLSTIARDGIIQNAEVKFLKKNGEPFWASISAVAVKGEDGGITFLDGLITDITPQKQQATSMRIQLDLGQALLEARGLEDALTTCLSAAIEISAMDAGGIYLIDETTGSVDLKVAKNLGDEFVATISRYPPESPNARMVMAGKSLYLPYSRTGLVHNQVQEAEGLHAIAIIPVSFKGNVIACMNITSHSQDEIPPPARVALETVAAQIGGAIRRFQSEEALAHQNERLRTSEEALRKEREQIEEITATLPGVVYQFYARADGSMGLYYVSSRAPDVFGMSGDLETFFERFTACVDPRDRGAFLESINNAVKFGKPWHFEGRFIHASGREIWFEGKSRPVSHGDELVFSGTLSDITARKQAEAALRESEERLQLALDGGELGTWYWNVQTGAVTFNERWAAMLGYRPGEIDPHVRSWELLVHPGDMPRVWEVLNAHLDGKTAVYECEHRLRHKNGSWIWVLDKGKVIHRDAEGRPLFAAGTHLDITRRKQAEEALAEANRKTKLLNSMTRHDVLNQLLALRGFAQVAAKNVSDPVLAGQLAKIQAIGETITNQVEFTRAYQELGLNVPNWLRLEEVITRTAGSIPVRNADTCHGIEVFCDPMLEKVFFNLFENASRHGKHVTEIHVSCQQEGDILIIVVKDNGIGVPAPDKEKIFNRGFGKNTGLGLFLSKEILAITGITIRENGEPGNGARFEMIVPKGVFRHNSCKYP